MPHTSPSKYNISPAKARWQVFGKIRWLLFHPVVCLLDFLGCPATGSGLRSLLGNNLHCLIDAVKPYNDSDGYADCSRYDVTRRHLCTRSRDVERGGESSGSDQEPTCCMCCDINNQEQGVTSSISTSYPSHLPSRLGELGADLQPIRCAMSSDRDNTQSYAEMRWITKAEGMGRFVGDKWCGNWTFHQIRPLDRHSGGEVGPKCGQFCHIKVQTFFRGSVLRQARHNDGSRGAR